MTHASCDFSGIGTCSLRDAITKSNALQGWSIQFAIGTGHQTIQVMTALPDIITRGTIDGRTQPGYAGAPLIELRPALGSTAAYGLHMTMDGLNAVKALIIGGFNGACPNCAGIWLDNPGTNFVQGCYIGTDASGMVANGNFAGILDTTLGGNTYGGNTPANRNVISGNVEAGIVIAGVPGYSVQNVIAGNYIGVNAAGTAVMQNSSGDIFVGPPYPGFTIGNVIGGPPGSGAGNVIAGTFGIVLAAGQNNLVQGNYIGLDATGTTALPMDIGIDLQGETNDTLLNNVISATGDGIRLEAGSTGLTVGTKVQGNYIGTDATGNRLIGGGNSGIGFWGAQNNTIGGAGTGQGNVMGGFNEAMYFGTLTSTGNIVQGNSIGLGADGQSPIPNILAGITVLTGGNETIGGTGTGEGNIIAYSGLGTGTPGHPGIAPGVWVQNSTGNVILGNSIFGNTGMGIDFYSSASSLPYPNDVGDGDTGANNLQNFPLITGVTITPTSIRVQGTLNSTPNHPFLFEFYANRTPIHPADFLQGAAFLGVAGAPITTNGQGNASFDVTFNLTTVPNIWVSATATDVNGCPTMPQAIYCGNTSEFSQRSLFSVTPNRGPASGGTQTTLKGQLFQLLAVERFGGIVTTNTGYVDAQTITAVTPPMPAGSLLDVSVTNPDGSVAIMQKAFMVDFNDVPEGDALYSYIMSLAGDGVTSGCGGGNYCPNNSVTRAQMAVFLLKAKYGPWWMPPPPTGTVFLDVPSGSFAAAWIEELSREGITGGCGGGNYCPGNPVTRQQMAVFLLKTEHGSGYVPPPCSGIFADVPCPSAFANWIEQLFHENVTSGCGGGNYCPASNVTRGQMAVFLTKTFHLP